MNVYDVVRADQLTDGDSILLIRQIARSTVRIPVEDIVWTDFDDAIEVKGMDPSGHDVVYFLLPDEDVELWHS